MAEGLADFLLALEAGGPGDIALELHVGHFEGDGLAGLAVAGLVDAGHAAAADALLRSRTGCRAPRPRCILSLLSTVLFFR